MHFLIFCSGEALSCICELSGEFSIVTRHVSDDCGTFIQYNPDGSILEEHPQARTVGTTVTVKNLFAVLLLFHFESLVSTSPSKSISKKL